VKQRDKDILKALEDFRCLSRDQIAKMFYGYLKNPITNANYALKRLRDRGYVKANVSRQPYIYFPATSGMKKDSQKVDHFLGIADAYIELQSTGQLKEFHIEPKYGQKGTVEPDAFFHCKDYPFFLEFQNSVYSDKVMKAKIQRYMDYFKSDEWHNGHWQRDNVLVFPYILIITNKQYNIDVEEFTVLQVKSINSLIRRLNQ
jgi:rhamnose utilization protein RhaD (predicted bifunctional aldolase and dehydrogenase)